MRLTHAQYRMLVGLGRQRGGKALVGNLLSACILERRGLVAVGTADQSGRAPVTLTPRGRVLAAGAGAAPCN